MDDFKRKSIRDYTSWDMNWKCIQRNSKNRKKLKNLFKRKARRKLKMELKEEEE